MPNSDSKPAKTKQGKKSKKVRPDAAHLAPNASTAMSDLMQAGADKYAPTAWAGATAETNLHDITVPSGQLIQVMHVGPTGLLELGLLDSLDILGGLVQTEHVDRVAGRAPKKLTEAQEKARIDAEMKELLKDPKKVMSAMQMVDKVVCGVVMKPKVFAVPVLRDPTPQELAASVELDAEGKYLPPRVRGQVYVDSVDPTDKVFILNYVMGAVDDLSSFRQGLSEGVAALEPVEDVPVPAKRTPKRAKPAGGVSA
jgi:hypothetical protein